MVNLAKPRKVDESKNLLKKSMKSGRKLQLKWSFSEILSDFESAVCGGGLLRQSDNQVTSDAVRQLLSSLQSLLNRQTGDVTTTEEHFDQITESMVKCLNELSQLVFCESAFPESITLSALCISFLLINYYTYFAAKFTAENATLLRPILASCQVYFAFFEESFQLDRSKLVAIFDTILQEDSFQFIHSQIICTINEKSSVESKLAFRDVALLSGFLNCGSMLDLLIQNMIDVFLRLHPFIAKLCSSGVIHEFHVRRLLNQYLKALLDHRKVIREYCQTKDSPSSYPQLLLSFITATLSHIDNNWESPIGGVGNTVKQAYRYLIELTKEPLRESADLQQFIVNQFKRTLSLPFTCKSKYKKLSTLIQTLATEDIDTSQFETNVIPPDGNVKLCELPFYFEDNFALQVIQHLSINSLANSIADFYKSSVTSIRDTYSTATNEANKVTQVWSTHWLDAITHIFSADSALSNSTVVQNTLLAHIFPFTLQHIPNSMSILMDAFANCTYGQISIVRIFLEKSSLAAVEKLLPPRCWLLSMLADGDDMTRAEALALLVDEKFIHRNRALVCQLVLCFVRTNLNIDNASFRQRVICKLEQFYSKVIISICDRHDGKVSLEQMNETDRQVVHFVKDTLDVLALSLFPGSSFQRKFTSLSIFSSIISILEKEDSKGTFLNLFRQLTHQKLVPWQQLIMLGLVDKDDKIRRLTTEISIQFSKSPLAQCSSLALDSANFDSLCFVAEKFLCSPRHQESHIGGLLLKCLLRCHISQLAPFKSSSDPGLSLITSLISNASNFYSAKFRSNLLASSKCDPLHGYFLALNHSLTFISFHDGVLLPKGTEPSAYESILFDGALRGQVFQPCIRLSLDCLDYFLKLLIPSDNLDASECPAEQMDDNEVDMCSPSFHEMCQSIESIIRKDSNRVDENIDVFLSNDFQLILSMCWLNIKENCFLLTTLTSLFADILSVAQENECLSSRLETIDVDFYLMSAEELLQISSKIVTVMLRCRHKGVIEASGVSLTKFTRTILRIQCYLNNGKHINAQMKAAFRKSLESFVTEILSIIDFRQAGSSVTRRSAGLALIVQAVLVGEAEAISLDGIRPIQEGDNESPTLYDRVIALLVSIATSAIAEESSQDEYQFIDLPQSNAMHVLRNIIGTSALAHLSSKTVEQLFPLCVTGFTSPLWQIRNASLQLFGACITRMLGQKKRVKSLDTDLGNEFGTTITFEEFAARYPSLLGVITGQFDSCTKSADKLHPELVPVLSLLASFTALGQTDREVAGNAHQLIHFFLDFLSNRIWKIRMLAARSLANLWPLGQLEHFVIEMSGKEVNQLNSNLLHGLLCCVSNLFEMRSLTSPEDMPEYRLKYQTMFAGHLKDKCDILTNLGGAIFQPSRASFDDYPLEDEQESECPNSATSRASNETLDRQLTLIKENVNFKKSDDIRHQAALDLQALIESLDISQFSQIIRNAKLSLFVDILLTLLEDEDREIRLVGQKITTILYRSDNTQSTTRLLNQTVAIDYFFSWMSQHLSNDHHLIESLIGRLCASCNLQKYQQLFRRQKILDKECEFVLFEREEKNVFAEPYVIVIRIAAFLRSFLTPSSAQLLNRIRVEIGKSCELLEEILSQHNGGRLESLMLLSIWKLPDFFCRLVSLYVTLSLVEEHQLGDNKTTKTLKQIRCTFPFVVVLQSYLKSAGSDLLAIDCMQ